MMIGIGRDLRGLGEVAGSDESWVGQLFLELLKLKNIF